MLAHETGMLFLKENSFSNLSCDSSIKWSISSLYPAGLRKAFGWICVTVPSLLSQTMRARLTFLISFNWSGRIYSIVLMTRDVFICIQCVGILTFSEREWLWTVAIEETIRSPKILKLLSNDVAECGSDNGTGHVIFGHSSNVQVNVCHWLVHSLEIANYLLSKDKQKTRFVKFFAEKCH